MNDLSYQTLGGQPEHLDTAAIDTLAAGIRGGVLTPSSPDYERSRVVWNAMVERRPALIARCLGAQDVRHAVAFAQEHHMLVSMRGGGHHIAGNAVAEGGLMIDLSAMRSVRVDPAQRTARVGAGALLSDFDRETQAFGLATPLGINSTTGIAGLCLGGGFGWLTRKYGLTIDNLISADIVTADGSQRVASATEEPDLFWAIRGGGGNFGVVTSFEFQLHPVGPEVYAGLVVYPLEQAQQVLRAWRDFTEQGPEEMSVWAVLRQAPPLPFLPASVHGQNVVVLALVHAGDVESGRLAAQAILGFGTPVGSALGPQPYAGFQTAFDPLLTPGARNYWKSHNFSKIGDEFLDLVIDAARHLPGPECELFIAQLGGALTQVSTTETAYAGRDANYVMNVHGRWRDPAQDTTVRNWSRGVFRDAAPYATGGGYVNFLTEDETARTESAYGPNYDRLRAIKRRFDPKNLFRVNQNVEP